MDYVAVTFEVAENTNREMLMASLTGIGVEGFEEKEDALIAYIPQNQFNEVVINDIATQHKVAYDLEDIKEQNWNQQWEQNFQPVIVDDFCTVRADFHNIEINTPYEIVITPKMSFGTGHHATTQLMMTEMKSLQWIGARVLDFGTGTGILAILAEMLGAAAVVALDNDEWSYQNAKENIERNNCNKIEVLQGSLEDVTGSFNIILANINRHILLQYMDMLYVRLVTGGIILMSGLLKDDKDIIKEAAREVGFKHQHTHHLNNWIILLFEK